MHIIIGLIVLGIFLALLRFWLAGGWFARVIMFLLLAMIGFGGGLVGVAATYGFNHVPLSGALLGAVIGAALAWPAASLPTYHYRREIKRMINTDPRHLMAR